MSVKTCSICLEDMLEKNISERKYNCNNYFHKSCISEWKGNCPLCRANVLIVEHSNNSSSIDGFKKIQKHIPISHINIYIGKWQKKDCLTNNHNIFFRQPFGVIGICETCKHIECFNLCHPI